MANQLTRYATVARVDTANQGYFIGGAIVPLLTSLAEPAGASDRVHLYGFVLPFRQITTKVITEVTTLVAASLYSVGIYNADGTVLLIDSGTFNGASSGIKQNTITAVTLEPGPYLFAQTANTTTTLACRSWNLPNIQALLNGTDRTNSARATNTSSSGVLPATTGTLIADTSKQMICAVFAP